MRTTYNISFYCRSSKADRNGLSPVEVSVIINGKRVFIQLQRKEYAEAFKKSVESKRSNSIKEYLEEVRNQFNKIQVELMRNGLPLTADNLKKYFRTGGIQDYSLNDLFEEYRKFLWNRVIAKDLSIKAYDKYRNAFDCFFKHIDRTIPVERLSQSMIQNFLTECNKIYQPSTTNGIMTKIKTVILYAKDNGKISINPFVNIKYPKGKKDIEYLTEEEIRRIKAKEMPIERLEKVKDIALFQMSSGLSYSDMVNLKKEDIKFDGDTAYIFKKRQKTGVDYTAVILSDGIEILKKYDYQLPIMTNQRTNAYLKEIQTLCGIEKNLHTHLFRKTYGTRLLNAGVRLETVSRTLGHSSVKQTESVYSKLLNKTIIEEVKKVAF